MSSAQEERKCSCLSHLIVVLEEDGQSTTGSIYRVLNLHGDAFLLEHSEHRGINTFNLCTRAQHQNLCTEKRKSVKRGAAQNDPKCGSFLFLLPIFGSSMWNRERLSTVISL